MSGSVGNRRLALLSSLLLFRQKPDSLLFRLCVDCTDPDALGELISRAAQEHWSGSLWHCCIAQALIESENPFSLACERRHHPGGSLYLLAQRDALSLLTLLSLAPTETPWDILCPFHAEPERPTPIGTLAASLAAEKDAPSLLSALALFYETRGVGQFALYDAFRITETAGCCTLLPIRDRIPMQLSDLVGYEAQKKQLLENTETFVCGGRANNVLLYGDAGTGKSTSVQSLVTAYASGGLRLIELYPHQYPLLPALLALLKTRNYRFLLLLDDLSFEEHETSYKYLKAMLEGGAETGAENVRVYATSNRRNLVRENWSDRSDMEHNGDIHRSDTMEEKLSLAGRFGLRIFYPAPSFEEYQHIVSSIYRRDPNGGELTAEQLRSAASAWQVRSGSRSGRTARQLVDALSGQCEPEQKK